MSNTIPSNIKGQYGSCAFSGIGAIEVQHAK